MAARLSEDLFVKVALLEAGDEETLYPMIDIPLAMLDLQRTSADWAYKTVPQNFSCSGLRNEVSCFLLQDCVIELLLLQLAQSDLVFLFYKITPHSFPCSGIYNKFIVSFYKTMSHDFLKQHA